MSELAKKTAAIARAKRAKIICKASRWGMDLSKR
jgi:hypothetical protein